MRATYTRSVDEVAGADEGDGDGSGSREEGTNSAVAQPQALAVTSLETAAAAGVYLTSPAHVHYARLHQHAIAGGIASSLASDPGTTHRRTC